MTYKEARAAMAQHFKQARAGNPCSCLGAGGRGEMCPDGAGIYAEVVSPSGLDNAVPPVRRRGGGDDASTTRDDGGGGGGEAAMKLAHEKTTAELLDEAAQFVEEFGAGRASAELAASLQARGERFGLELRGHPDMCKCRGCLLNCPATESER